MSNRVCYVYWIHLPEHTDIKKSGYVGITTKTVDKRFKGHLQSVKEGSTLRIHNAIRKYGDRIVVSEVLCADKELCLLVEEELRPVANMGGEIWNIGSGGSCPTVGYKHTEETKKRLTESWKTRPPKTAETSLKMTLAKTGRFGWLNNGSCKQAWSLATEFYDLFTTGMMYEDIYRNLGMSRSNFARVKKKIDSGWIPSKDPEFLEWREAYLKEKEQHGT